MCRNVHFISPTVGYGGQYKINCPKQGKVKNASRSVYFFDIFITYYKFGHKSNSYQKRSGYQANFNNQSNHSDLTATYLSKQTSKTQQTFAFVYIV